MRAEVDDSEAVLLVGYHKNVGNGLGSARLSCFAAIVDANAVQEERIWNRGRKCISVP